MAARTRLVCFSLWLFLAASGCGVRASAPETNFLLLSGKTASPSQRLSHEGQAALLGLIEEARLPDLRWPDFQDYQAAVRTFYQSVGLELVWTRGGQQTRQALAIINVLQNADAKGLNPQDYDGPNWSKRQAALQHNASEFDLVRFDLDLTVSAMRYASDLHTGRINPQDVHFNLAINRSKTGWANFLRDNLVDAQAPEKAFDQLEPPFPQYQQTQKALNTYRRLAQEDDAEALPALSAPLQPGGQYVGIPRLVRLLRKLGDLSPETLVPADGVVYEASLVGGVKRFQERHGLKADGQLDRETLRQLNTPLSRRVDQIQLALERWRWLQFEFSHPSILINIPEFRLHAFDDEARRALTMKVVVGKAARHKTPLLVQEMKHVIFRPYWNVPASIQRAELVPAIARNPGYIAKHAYQIVDARTRMVSTAAETGDLLHALRSGRLAIRQRPGSKNSLGLVKFVFPNDYDVYLHGTPAMDLFARSRRDLSHGCIRVENPEELAVWVLRSNPGWNPEMIRSAMNGSQTVQVNVARPFRVRIVYVTAMVSDDGTVRFYDDVYGYDTALRRILADRSRSPD